MNSRDWGSGLNAGVPGCIQIPCTFFGLTCSALLVLPSRSSLLLCRGDLVQIETWFQEDGKLAAQRDFLITELGSRRVLGRATSTWVTINIAVRGCLPGCLGAWMLAVC